MWSDCMRVHADAFFYLSRHLAPNMVKNGGGSLLAIASNYGMVGASDAAAYAASKAACIALCKSMALEYAKHNVRVNCVCPGATETPMIADNAKEYAKSSPSRELVQPLDIANAVLYLTSPAGRMIRGIELLVDGGLAKRPDLEGLTGTVIAGPDRQGQYCLKMMLEEGELDTVTADAENITLRLRRGALAELVLHGTQVDAKEPSIPDRPFDGVPFLAALYHDVKLPGKGSEGRKDGEKTADSKPNAEKLANKAHVRRPSPSPREAEDLRPPRPSRLVSLSPQAAVALVAAGDVPEHAITEVQHVSHCFTSKLPMELRRSRKKQTRI
eukprot:symbB.v1.2.012112.t1/scaffold830.1/size159233/5